MELILTGIAYSIAVLVISIFVTIPFSSWLAGRVGAIDLPGEIKVHSQPTPRLGGLGILLTFLLSLSGLLATANFSFRVSSQLIILLFLLVSLAIIGFLDDVHDLKPWLRFLLEGIIGVVLSLSILGTQTNWIVLVIAWFWIVGLINAYNFLDGLDGLAASIATVNLLALAIMLSISGNVSLAIAASTMALATCGFLRFNWPPATIFMGDIGSLSLGFVISALSLVLVVDQSFSLRSILAVFLAASLPLGDLIATVLRRFISGKPLFQGDRGHFYDLLVDRVSLSKPQAMYFSLFVALVVCSLGTILFIPLTVDYLPFTFTV